MPSHTLPWLLFAASQDILPVPDLRLLHFYITPPHYVVCVVEEIAIGADITVEVVGLQGED